MRAFLFTLAFASVHGATHDCSTFSINEVSDVCPKGYELASGEYVEQCASQVCLKLGAWSMAKYGDPKYFLIGPGYDKKCTPQVYDGRSLGAAICTPSGDPCAQLFVLEQRTCPFGTLLAPAGVVESCTAQLCEGLEVNSAYHYADATKMVVGRALNPSCGPVKNNRTLSYYNSLCVGAF